MKKWLVFALLLLVSMALHAAPVSKAQLSKLEGAVVVVSLEIEHNYGLGFSIVGHLVILGEEGPHIYGVLNTEGEGKDRQASTALFFTIPWIRSIDTADPDRALINLNRVKDVLLEKLLDQLGTQKSRPQGETIP